MLLDDPIHHLFGIAASRLDELVDSSLVSIQGYSVVTQDRKRGRGVILIALYSQKAQSQRIVLITNNTER